MNESNMAVKLSSNVVDIVAEFLFCALYVDEWDNITNGFLIMEKLDYILDK